MVFVMQRFDWVSDLLLEKGAQAAASRINAPKNRSKMKGEWKERERVKDTMKVRQKERGERQKHIADETEERLLMYLERSVLWLCLNIKHIMIMSFTKGSRAEMNWGTTYLLVQKYATFCRTNHYHFLIGLLIKFHFVAVFSYIINLMSHDRYDCRYGVTSERTVRANHSIERASNASIERASNASTDRASNPSKNTAPLKSLSHYKPTRNARAGKFITLGLVAELRRELLVIHNHEGEGERSYRFADT